MSANPGMIGKALGPCQIVAKLGEGGMGEVYQATDTRLGRTVAVKVLPQSHTTDPEHQQRFDREARAVAALSHPNICALFDVGHEGDVAYLVMEYLEGETLGARIARGGGRSGSGSRSVPAPVTPAGTASGGAQPVGPAGQPLPVRETVRIATALAEALAAAHAAGIVHRDLKPGNIMLTKAGVKVLDFGLAKALDAEAATAPADVTTTAMLPLTGSGTLLGTLPYMAPEQVEGRDADARSDIFALGAVIYERATVTPDGQRFLIQREPPDDFLSTHVLFNWPARLPR